MGDRYKDFDLENSQLPEEIKSGALTSGGYPYDEKLKRKVYEEELENLQLQLVRLQAHLVAAGQRVIIVFEGRDCAGKSSSINAYREHLNPRTTLDAALPKPSDRERGQWYFQRYVDHFPSAGETILFDRSWYNRSGVEMVMGFASPSEVDSFLLEVPNFERMIVNDGIHLFKFWLSIGREMQLKRFWERRQDPLKQWKLSPIDLKAMALWDEYTEAWDRTLAQSDTPHAPWTVVLANDERRARINTIRSVLSRLDYEGKDEKQVGAVDPRIVMEAEDYLRQRRAAEG